MTDQSDRGSRQQADGAVPPGETDFRAGTRASFFSRAYKSIRRRVSAVRWRSKMAKFGTGASIERPYCVLNPGAIEIGDDVNIWPHARIEAIRSEKHADVIRLKIGQGTAIQPHVHIGAAHQVILGKHVLIASNVYITDHDHDWLDPMDPASTNSRLLTGPVHIGDYTWLGENVMVLKGVTIGERSVVGAGSIVTRDIPPMSIAVGSPAKVIRRYDTDLKKWMPVQGEGDG